MVKRIMLVAGLVAAVSAVCGAGGLITTMGEIRLENVRYGQAFSMRESLNMPLKVTNTSDRPVEIVMEIIVPKADATDLKPGYEPIPDQSWIKLERSYFPRIEPNANAESDIVIEVPKDKKYLGKNYQFYIWTRTTGGLGQVNVAVMSRYLITTISADNMAILEGKKKPVEVKANFDFSLRPYELFVKQVKPGQKYDLETLAGEPIKIVNPNAEAMQFKFYALRTSQAETFFKEGYEDIPNASFVTFKEGTLTVPEESIKRTKAYLQIPDKKEYRGKRYQCILVLESAGQNVNAKVYSRLYITTEE